MKTRVFAMVAMLSLTAAACSSDTTTTTTAADSTTTTTSAETMGSSLTVAMSSLGDTLADGEGNTLYLFVTDAQGESTCYGDCEANWPPLTDSVTAGAGVDAALIGSSARTDGTTQVTYNGWPLYYYAGDMAPGETSGQGVGGVWFAITSTGEAVG